MSISLSQQQLVALKADILATPAFASKPMTAQAASEIADEYNKNAIPDFWVYRTQVSKIDFCCVPSVDATTWSWPAYIARSQGERDGWRELFDTGYVNCSQANVRTAFTDIFSGAQNNAPAQRTHCAAVSRRTASLVEKLFAVGTGSTGSPATMGFEGAITYDDVQTARGLP